MHDNDIFLIIDRDEAVFIGCFLIGLLAFAFAGEEPKTKPKPAADSPCAVTVAQYGAGDRWARIPRQPACAGELAPLPAHVLTMPMEVPQ